MVLNQLDPKILLKISKLSLRARAVVEGFLAGQHRSPYHGWSLEFAQHREYSPGDEPRYIDWKVFGRTDRYFIKQYEEETNLRLHILLDSSNSMSFQSTGTTKLLYAKYLSAVLGYLMILQRDAVGLSSFSNDINFYIPPRNSVSHFNIIIEHLESLAPGDKTNLSEVLTKLAKRIKKRSLIIVISDLLDDPDKVINSLKYFGYKKHEVIVFQTLDPVEQQLPEAESVLFENLETGDKILTEPEVIRTEYKKIISSLIEKYRTNFLNNGIDYCLLTTNMPLEYGLIRYLNKREHYGKKL